MKVFQINDMVKGWFVGNFNPTALPTNDVEVAVKKYKTGDYESLHYHKIATEVTVIVDGQVKINGTVYSSGSIVVIEPNHAIDFLALTDVTTTVVKCPSAINDKYFGTPE